MGREGSVCDGAGGLGLNSENIDRRSVRLLILSCLLYGAGLRLFPICLPLALLIMAVQCRRGGTGWKIGCGAAWGLMFSAGFYFWALAYGILPWLGLVAVRGLPWALLGLPSALLCRRGTVKPWHQAIAFGLGLALVSWLLLVGPTGNDWETPAGAFTSWPELLGSLSYLGLAGYAFMLGSACALIGSESKLARGSGVIALTAWCCLNVALSSSRAVDPLPDLKVALLQTGWSQDEKWDAQTRKRGIELLLTLTRQAHSQGAEFVIWPETAWPNRGMRKRFHDTRAIGRLARNLEISVLASSIEEKDGTWLNSASLINETGKFTLEYQKERLAPFAEFLPVPRRIEQSLRKVRPFSYVSRFAPGELQPVMSAGPYRFRTLICFESMVPWPAAKAKHEVDFYVVLTNDAPMIYDWPKEDHFRSAVLRAVEFRKPVYQASNNGVTGIVNSAGRVVDRTALRESGQKIILSP